jgi:hypothetical protein
MPTSAARPSGYEPDQKGDAAMSAQAQYFEVDAIGVFPTLLLLLVIVLTALGIVAHVAFG